MNASVEQKMDALIEKIEYHRRRYYQDSDPEITDAEYDLLEKELLDLEKAHPTLVRPDSPSFRVGSGLVKDHPTRAHRRPMLSLENAYTIEDVVDFFVKTQKAAGCELDYAAELKIDGLSLSVIYEHGFMTRAITRGDGKTGEEVTLNAKTIVDLPLRIPVWSSLAEMEVRGEVYLAKSTFQKLNQSRMEAQLPLFANPRNAAAGSMRMKDSTEVAKRKLRILVFQALGPWADSFNSHLGCLAALDELGFPVNPNNTQIRDKNHLLDIIDRWQALRAELEYDTDGVVIKVDNPSFYERIGYTNKFPKWAAAYKFVAEQATTRINRVSVQVGRTGVLTPVAHFEPVQLAGTTVGKATLHNFDEIEKKDIRIGDWVFIEKGGDIIPKVVKVVLDKRPGDAVPIEVPERCPRCDGPTEQVPDQVAVRCVNLACPAQLERRITHFSGRNAMDIQGLGKERVQQMVAQGLLRNLADIYQLDKDKLWQLERVGDKWIANLLGEIEKSKAQPFSRLLFAVGIPMIGEKVADVLVEAFGSYDQLLAAEPESIAEIHGMGEKVAESLVHHLQLQSYREAFEAFRRAGLQLAREEKTEDAGPQPFADKTLVITGTFSLGSRTELTQHFKGLGAKVTGSVTKKTDYLLAGEKAGSKLAKARSLNVEVVDEEWVKQWLSP